MNYRKTGIFASFFLQTIINIFVQVISSNIKTYLDRTFKEEKHFILFTESMLPKRLTQMLTGIMHNRMN